MQSQVTFNRVPEKVPEKVPDKVPEASVRSHLDDRPCLHLDSPLTIYLAHIA